MDNLVVKLFLDIFLLLGVIFFIIAVFVKRAFAKKKEKCTYKVEAHVVKINKMERTESGLDPSYVSYFPVYEYEYMGKTYQSGSNVGNLESVFKVGKKVQIYIDPKNPETIYEDSIVPKMIVRIFKIVGVVFILVVVFLRFLLFSLNII